MTASGHGRMASVSATVTAAVASTATPTVVCGYLCLSPITGVEVSSRGNGEQWRCPAGSRPGAAPRGRAGDRAHRSGHLHRLGDSRLPRPAGRLDQEPRGREDGDAVVLRLRPRSPEEGV